jgi:hypothetical protein
MIWGAVQVVIGGGGACEGHLSSRQCMTMNTSVCHRITPSAGQQIAVGRVLRPG